MKKLEKDLIKEHRKLQSRLQKTKDYLLGILADGDDEDIRRTRLQLFAIELYSAALEARIEAIKLKKIEGRRLNASNS